MALSEQGEKWKAKKEEARAKRESRKAAKEFKAAMSDGKIHGARQKGPSPSVLDEFANKQQTRLKDSDKFGGDKIEQRRRIQALRDQADGIAQQVAGLGEARKKVKPAEPAPVKEPRDMTSGWIPRDFEDRHPFKVRMVRYGSSLKLRVMDGGFYVRELDPESDLGIPDDTLRWVPMEGTEYPDDLALNPYVYVVADKYFQETPVFLSTTDGGLADDGVNFYYLIAEINTTTSKITQRLGSAIEVHGGPHSSSSSSSGSSSSLGSSGPSDSGSSTGPSDSNPSDSNPSDSGPSIGPSDSGSSGAGSSEGVWIDVVTDILMIGGAYVVTKTPIRVLDIGTPFDENLPCCCDSEPVSGGSGSGGGSSSACDPACCEAASISFNHMGFDTINYDVNYELAATGDGLCTGEEVVLDFSLSVPGVVTPTPMTLIINGDPVSLNINYTTMPEFPSAGDFGELTIYRICCGGAPVLDQVFIPTQF
jgi:hypothetical protein